MRWGQIKPYGRCALQPETGTQIDAGVGENANSYEQSCRVRPCGRYLSQIEALDPFKERERILVRSLRLDADHFGNARAQTAQFVTYRFRLALVVEKLLPCVIRRPPALAAVVPAGDPRISPRSKRDAVRHRALLVSEGSVAFTQSQNAALHEIVGIDPKGPQKRHAPLGSEPVGLSTT